MFEFPASWGLLPVSEAVRNITITDKKIPQKDYLPSGKFPVIDQGQEFVGGFTDDVTKLVDCAQPVIVFGDHTRIVKLVKTAFAPGADGIKILQPDIYLLPALVEYFVRYLVTKIPNKGYARHYQYLAKSLLPIPPASEQLRIVAKIEELISELDNGIESLKTAQAQLKVYRQALLKHAFEGKLTTQWREANPDKLVTADALLKRIKHERAARYQQQIADWESGGKLGSKPKAPKELPPLTAEELADLPELPEGWGWVKLGELTWSLKDGPHFSPKYSAEGIPFISGGNVRPEGVDFSKAKFISKELNEGLSKRCKPEIGDVLYTKGGTTGIARVNTYDIDFNVWVHVAVLKITPAVKPFYLQHALNSSFCYAQSQKFTHGVGNQDLGLTRMVNIVLAICTLPEQQEVTNTVDDKMSLLDQLEQTITTSLQQAEALRQSILKKAFTGKLVPQDPNDEPASKLLARIRAERENTQKKPMSAKRRIQKVTNV
jgi:type I restriction enzyme S subunit